MLPHFILFGPGKHIATVKVYRLFSCPTHVSTVAIQPFPHWPGECTYLKRLETKKANHRDYTTIPCLYLQLHIQKGILKENSFLPPKRVFSACLGAWKRSSENLKGITSYSPKTRFCLLVYPNPKLCFFQCSLKSIIIFTEPRLGENIICSMYHPNAT